MDSQECAHTQKHGRSVQKRSCLMFHRLSALFVGFVPPPLFDFGSKTRGSQTPGSQKSQSVLQLFTLCLDFEDQCAGLLTNMHLGVKSCNTRQGATAGTAKHFTELPDCPSELRLGWWCTRLVLGIIRRWADVAFSEPGAHKCSEPLNS